MDQEIIVNSRPDREIRKKIITKGDYSCVPYEDSRCKIILSEIKCENDAGSCDIEAESQIFGDSFAGNVLIGDSDCFIDKDFELLLQQMCCGETSLATLVYRDSEEKIVKQISCKVELVEVTEEQLIPDWGWERLFECALHHKNKGVGLIIEKRTVDAFRRFSKALKMLIAIEPIDPAVIPEEKVKEMIELKVKLYNNLAHCQLEFNQYEATLELCNKALKFDPDNAKAFYRRSSAYTGLKLYEEAWSDIQQVLKISPNDKSAILKANLLKPLVDKIKANYAHFIKKMFVP